MHVTNPKGEEWLNFMDVLLGCPLLYVAIFMPIVLLVAWLTTPERPALAVLAYLTIHFSLFASLQYTGLCFSLA